MKNLKFFVLLLLLFYIKYNVKGQRARILNSNISTTQPGYYNAVYIGKSGNSLRSRNEKSDDNGSNWISKPTKTNNLERIANKNFRRMPQTSCYDPSQNSLVTFFVALDDPNIAKGLREPPDALKQYYLRYRVSTDNGDSWLFDDPIIVDGKGYNKNHPMPNVNIGKNAVYMGDFGTIPIINKDGKIILPVQVTVLGQAGKYESLSGGYTYMNVVVLNGTWGQNHKIIWKASSPVSGDPIKTTRGLFEPTIIQFNNGKFLMVMRGSNGGKKDLSYKIPSYKWYSVSTDGGYNWTSPKPWGYTDGSKFYSPSSMSILFKHSSGRVFWAGNISSTNAKGNNPRSPLVFGEVDPQTMQLKKSSLITLDAIKPSDSNKPSLELSHVTMIEDRNTKQIIVTYPRYYNNNKSREWSTIKLSIN